MKRLVFLLLLLAPVLLGQDYNIGFSPRLLGGGSGVDWDDTFTRADGSDLTGAVGDDCSSEGPSSLCAWTEVNGDLSIASNAIVSNTAKFKLVANSNTDTLAQYAGATTTDTSQTGRKSGPVVRATSSSSASDCWYTFEMNSTTSFRIRACRSTNDCGVIETFTDGGGDFTNMAQTDSLGISVNVETGDDVQFTVYKFDTANVPASFSSWAGSATNTYSVCDSAIDCDRQWDTAPSVAKCTADNKRVGISKSSSKVVGWDTWAGGDV